MLNITNSSDFPSLIKELPTNPGVYKFKDKENHSIYIGKAKNLKNRLRAYLSESGSRTKKTRNILMEADSIELMLTNNELESLLLEQHLIKQDKPKYNVQFKDDKGYPRIVFEVSKQFPSVKSTLGKSSQKDLYFGPFPSSNSVKSVLDLIQKIFKLRDCTDSFFKNRKRPCLQFEIGKCSAPCVGLIKKEDYLKDVFQAKRLLDGNSEDLVRDLYKFMDLSSEKRQYEKAASYRDKISALRDIQRNQNTYGFLSERDAISLSKSNLISRIGVTKVRGGWIVAHKNFIAEEPIEDSSLVERFIMDYYLDKEKSPSNIITLEKVRNKKVLEKALSEFHGKKIKIITKHGKKDLGLLEICKSNTDFSLSKAVKKRRNLKSHFNSIAKFINSSSLIDRIESIDISHHSGKNAIGACIVYDQKGKKSDEYRLYNISKNNMGNDIGSMKEIIKRRYGKDPNNLNRIPDLLIIDGSYNHLNAVKEELRNINLSQIKLLAISKGIRRKEEFDSLIKENGEVIEINRKSKFNLLLQEIRDESHRFSLKSQRNKLSKKIRSSDLDNIEGIGRINKNSLLRYFGNVEQIKKASINDLVKVNGIGKKKATHIHFYFQKTS